MVVKKFKFTIFGVICLIGLIYLSYSKIKNLTKADLIIYSYSSFTSKWGPGPLIKAQFEEKCHCVTEFRNADDSRLLIQRIELERDKDGADIVIGLNQWDVERAKLKLGFKNEIGLDELINKDEVLELSGVGESAQLVPFDWGPMAFNTKKGSPVSNAKSLNDFLMNLPEKSLALQDPRTSSPGLNFLFWLVQVLGEDEAFQYLDKLKSKIFNVTSGWSTSYGLFQKGQAQAVFSYVTSPLYHLIEEKDSNYLALPFEEGQPIHIEYAGVLPQCINCERASEFMRFLISPSVQKILMEKNYMLPVIKSVASGSPWDLLSQYRSLPLPNINLETQQKILDRWTTWSQNQ